MPVSNASAQLTTAPVAPTASAPAANQSDPASVSSLIDRVGRMARGLQFSAGLNPAQWESLRFLANANLRSRTPSSLSRFLGSTKGTASQTLIALEAKGLIRRVQDRRDRRVAILEVTEGGHRQLDGDPLRALERAVAGLPPQTRASLAKGLSALTQALCEHNGWPAIGVCCRCGHFQGSGAQGSARCGLANAELAADDSDRHCIDFRACGHAADKQE